MPSTLRRSCLALTCSQTCASRLVVSHPLIASHSHGGILLQVIVLEDNDVVHLRAGAYGIFNASITERHTAVPRLLETLTWRCRRS